MSTIISLTFDLFDLLQYRDSLQHRSIFPMSVYRAALILTIRSFAGRSRAAASQPFHFYLQPIHRRRPVRSAWRALSWAERRWPLPLPLRPTPWQRRRHRRRDADIDENCSLPPKSQFENSHFTNFKNRKNLRILTNFKTANEFYCFIRFTYFELPSIHPSLFVQKLAHLNVDNW